MEIVGRHDLPIACVCAVFRRLRLLTRSENKQPNTMKDGDGNQAVAAAAVLTLSIGAFMASGMPAHRGRSHRPRAVGQDTDERIGDGRWDAASKRCLDIAHTEACVDV